MANWKGLAGAVLLAGALALAGVLAAGAASPAVAGDLPFSEAGLVRGLLPTVVNITARAATGEPKPATSSASANEPSGSFEIVTSAGSGFVVDPAGVIVTNWHVVGGAYDIDVTFSDGITRKAKIWNAAKIVDIALLKVEADHPLAAVRWGDSSQMQIGDPVLAIGNPLGIGESVTAGIVSALNRNIKDTPYDDFIQTDAPINHGNSGGALFNLNGELIGINTALISSTTSNAGLGFAIPANDAKLVIQRLMEFGWARPGYLGMKVQQVSDEMAAALGMNPPQGSIVAWVAEGGPAEKAGLQQGDVIISLNGQTPSDERALLRMIASAKPGEPAALGILRDGAAMQISATIGEWPKMQWEKREGAMNATEPHWNIPHDLGLKVRTLTKELRAQNNLPPGPAGVLVSGVTMEADAARSGITMGDVVLRVGSADVATPADLQREIDKARARGMPYALFLVLTRASLEPGSKSPGPKWMALRLGG